MDTLYFESPHKQITEDFTAHVVNVHDGDTITVEWSERDFRFPIRFGDTAAPEMNEAGGHEAQQWLENRILDKDVTIQIKKENRVDKFGRLLGTVIQGGQDVGEEETILGLTTTWLSRPRKNEGEIPQETIKQF